MSSINKYVPYVIVAAVFLVIGGSAIYLSEPTGGARPSLDRINNLEIQAETLETLVNEHVRVNIDGLEVVGLQTLDFKVMRTEADISGITWTERIGVDSGQVVVMGTISFHPLNPHLDELLYMGVPTPFAMVVTLMNGEEQVRQITFGECYLSDKSFSLATGVGVTTYTFVSVRVREE